MALRSRQSRRPMGPKQNIQNNVMFSGTAQAGAARQRRAHALAEELLARGCLYIEKQVWDESAREFRKAIKMEPDYAEAYNNLGLCLLYANKPEEAVEALQQAVEHFPQWHIAEANLALAYQKMSKHAEAIEHYQKAVAKHPKNGPVWMALGDSFTSLGRMDEALQAYETAVEHSPKFDLAYSRIGMLHARRNRIDDARAALAKALAIEPDNPEAASVLGAIAARQGDLNQAQEYFDKVKGYDDIPVPAQRGIHRLEVFREGLKRAFEEWKQNVPPAPELAVCYYNLALAHMAQGNEHEAKNAFQQAADHRPEWAEPVIWFGFFAAQTGDALQARRYWENALKLQPENGMLFEQLAYISIAMGLQKEADSLFNKALDFGREIPQEDLKPDASAGRSGLTSGLNAGVQA